MAAEETRMAAAIIPHLPPATLVFHAGQPYDLWETWMGGAIVIRRSRNRELRCRNPIIRHLLAAARLTQGPEECGWPKELRVAPMSSGCPNIW